MSETRVYLSLGSNVGGRAKNLRAAIDELPHAGVAVKIVSSFYETEPVDLREQPWFLNCAVKAETHFDAMTLLRALREIETKMGSFLLPIFARNRNKNGQQEAGREGAAANRYGHFAVRVGND